MFEPEEVIQKPPSSVEFREWLTELELTPSVLASYLRHHGDFRSHDTILRGVQRALSGDTAVSGELSVIVKMLLKQRRRYQRANKIIQWTDERNGIHATVRGFKISLYANTNGLWQIHVISPCGYSHPFPAYPNKLESAKLKALQCLEEAEELLEGWALEKEVRK